MKGKSMLGENDIVAVVAVKDLDSAKAFYGGKLGLKADEGPDEGGVNYKSGSGKLFVYKSQFAGTNEATAASWYVEDVKQVVRELKGKGITFEQYDAPGVTREGDIHISGQLQSAWFKDPDGNILNVVSQGS